MHLVAFLLMIPSFESFDCEIKVQLYNERTNQYETPAVGKTVVSYGQGDGFGGNLKPNKSGIAKVTTNDNRPLILVTRSIGNDTYVPVLMTTNPSSERVTIALISKAHYKRTHSAEALEKTLESVGATLLKWDRAKPDANLFKEFDNWLKKNKMKSARNLNVPIGLKNYAVIPAYFDQSGNDMKHWQKLQDTVRYFPNTVFFVVLNPNNGPGQTQDNFHKERVKFFGKRLETLKQNKNAKIIGYTPTGHATVPVDTVKAMISNWYGFYPKIDGFFIEEQASSDEKLDYYNDIVQHARTVALKMKLPAPVFVGNPGTIPDEVYVESQLIDISCIYEQDSSKVAITYPDWVSSYSPARFAIISYGVNDPAVMRKLIQDARRNGIGGFFVSDLQKQGDGEQYRGLPTYWSEFVKCLSN